MKATPIAINLISFTSESQCRAATDRNTVEEYAQCWRSDADFPPVDLFTHGREYYPGDGMHRILAAKLAGRAAILAYVYRGDERDAFLHGCASNQTHGLRRSNADKRHMVSRMLNDAEWVKWSDRRIAEKCGVSAQFVANVRNELSTVDSSPACRHADTPRLGADGKLRRRPIPCTDKGGSNGIPRVPMGRFSLAGSTMGNLPLAPPSDFDPAVRRKEALTLLGQLKNVLHSLELYDCCAKELEAIGDRVGRRGVAGLSA
jgi:hypothetical protein